MAKLTHAESRRLYSWWWDSHISPKNSKWLQENLTDMDIKVKSMIKLIEEDADSFARRAEMYYKKRPELMKLVEEFYRAYRALAERYDHATGALRQAQRTMAEAFPNQIPFALSEESPSASSATEAALHAPEMPPPFRSMFVSDDTHKDALHVPSQFHDIKRNGAYSEENEALTSKKGLKQLNGMFAEGRARKGLNSQDEGNGSEHKLLQEVSQIPRETQNYKGHVKSKSVRADDVEAAVHSLKETISNLESEKEAALLQHQLSLERISKMEAEISSCQEELKKLNDEMLMGVSKLNSAEERCLLLDTANRSLQLEVEMLKQRAKDQQEELSKKQEELENLNISIQDDRLHLEKLHSQTQEEGRVLALEVQRGNEKLKDMELSKLGLEEEIQKLTKDNGRLNEQILASAFEIISLQDEIILLKESKVKLENEVILHVEEKRVLQRELSCLKEDKNDLEQRHCWLTEKIEAVNTNVESLQATVTELQAGNAELKEICKKHEDEKVVHLESLKHMEKMSEKNVVLETSLLDANAEIESSIEKIKTLEESCRSLKGMISIHLSEKAVLVSQVESITQEMEKLSEGNTFLENSLSDVNVELEGLRVKSKVLEESCQSLYVQNFSLLSEKSTLVSQVERTIQSLENLENMYEDLEVKHLNLEREKDLPLRHMMELQDSFKREKEEYETLIMSIILSSKSQLSTLENQISLLQQEGRLREEEFEVEQYEVMDAQIENFILQRCLRDTNENNSILSVACQKHLEASKCADKVISDLKQELFAQEKKLTTSSVRSGNLKVGIQLMLSELCANKDCESLAGIEDEVLLQLTLREIRGLLNSISDAQDENQHLLLEKSVIITILEHMGLNVMHLTMEKIALEQESKIRTEELSALQSKELELQERNEQLRQEFYDLKEKENTLEEENSVVLAEVMTMEYLYLIFRSSSAEKALELQSLRSDLDSLCGVKNGLDQEIRLMNEKLASVEAENVHLEDDLHTTRDLCKQLNLEIESGKGRLAQKDIELLQENHRFLSIQDKNTESYKNLEVLQLDIERAMLVREELENKVFTLSKENAQRENEITCIRQKNDKLHKEVEDHKAKEEQLIYDQQRGVDEVKSCEIEIETLLNGNHIATVNAAVFEEKILELLIACEISSMVQIETLHEELTVRNANMDESREKLASMEGENGSLKEELNAYLVLVTALWDDITSLEENTLLLANHRTSNRREKQENLLAYFQHSKSSQEPRGNRSATLTAGLLELQKLQAKVKALQKLVVDTETLLEQDMFESNTNLEAALKEIELLKSKDIVMQLEKSEEPGADLKLQNGDAGISEVKYEQMMKDIQLDIVSSSSQYGNDVGSYRPSPTEKDGTNDRLFDSCQTTIEKASPVTSVHEIEYQIDAMEEEKTEYPSCELVSEKELSIDKLALPKKVTEYDRELKRGAIERLSSNAQRLSILQTSVQELRRNMESSETTDFPTTSLEFDMVKAQLKEAEGAILQLADTNRILTEKAEQVSPSADSPVVKQNEKRNKIRRQVSERARRGSEKIGRLELDLQKIQYILLKLKEEHINRRAKATDKRRVLLKDYLYGTVDSRRQKKRPSCCMIPKTKDD